MPLTPTAPFECTVLFADVVDSTQLYERIGNTSAFRLVDRSLRIARDVIENKNGIVVKHTGDGLLAIFKKADNAAEAAINIHTQLRELPPSNGQHLAVKTGFHFGTVIKSGNDIFGETVNIAARLTELASPGRAITSAETVQQMSMSWREQLNQLPSRILRGASRPTELFELRCESLGDVTVVRNMPFDLQANVELRLYLHDQTLLLNETKPIARIGRDSGSDLHVGDSRASRRHAEIELRGDKFVLVDRSSNGTYIAIDGEAELFLRREEAVLHGKGHFALGDMCVDNPYAISFVCI